ncbi:WD40-repeat-containing domain protein [Chytridium lagenaria]|nr:WD40-repeat-containing domain protein [Chytridium lagenaria]
MERAVVGNTYEKKHLLYRNIDEEAAAAARLQHLQDISQEAEKLIDEAHAEEEEEEEKREEEEVMEAEKKNAEVGAGIPTLNALWSYRCELTRGRTVMYMAWNKQNEDILAVAYAESKTTTSPVLGLVLCWSPKNPEWPERIYRSTSPITAIDFSRTNPNLLAVGFMDGRIAVYDVRRKEDRPRPRRKTPRPRLGAQMGDRERVIGDDQSRGETLVSVSTDGRVCQWMIRKGFEYTDLMTLKRVTRQQETKPNAGDMGAWVKDERVYCETGGGLCFDFNPNDSNIYIVGTEDGYIHRCSCSYNEQYLTTQFGHTGSVYKIKYSPFLSTYFLSCSADWTVRLWGVDDEDAIFKFQSGKDAITDIAWSWNSATVFGCVSNDGRMEIWDLQFSVLDPAILHTVLDRRLTAIIFAARSPTVLIGDDNGTVSVFNLRGGTSVPKHVMEEQAAVLARVIANKNQTVTSVGGGGGAEV